MSLMKNNLALTVKKQYFYKLKGGLRFFSTIVLAQIIVLYLAISSAFGMSTTSNGIYNFSIHKLSTLPVFIITALCIAVAAMFLNSKEYKDIDFTFVSNQISSNLSNIAFIITLSLFGAITTSLSGPFMRAVRYLFVGGSQIIESGFYIGPLEIILGLGAVFLYILLISSLAYFASVFAQKSYFAIVGLFLLIGLIVKTMPVVEIFRFYTTEGSFPMFMAKTLITSLMLFTGALFLSNKQEVRR